MCSSRQNEEKPETDTEETHPKVKIQSNHLGDNEGEFDYITFF